MRLLVLILVWLSAAVPQTARQADSVRRARMAELFTSGDNEGVLAACRELIDYHKANNNEKQIFDAYATYLDRLQMWGRYDEAMTVLQEMLQEAADRDSDVGRAITEFCFGQFYLGNRQPKEARIHHRRAFIRLQELGEKARALRSGFNLQAIAMNLEDPEGGLAINDSTQALLEQLEAGRIHPGSRLKQARYRMVLLMRLGRLKEAGPWKDSLLHYAEIVNESSQDELVLTAIAQYEQACGNKAAAYACLDTLISRALKTGDYTRVARFRLALADFQKDNGDLRLAADSYRMYAAENDSAQTHLTNEQLNRLTKQLELNELHMANQAIRQRNTILSITAVLLLTILLAILAYARVLHQKNRALYQASREHIHAEEKEEQAFVRNTQEQQTPEQKLYASLLSMMLGEKLFLDPDLNRDILSSRLGTNRTYLADAVKACTGLTLGEFINHHRIRWAAETLASDKDISVSAVGEDAGFSSRSTFNRLFQQEYGMSPGAYRAAAIAG